MIHITEAIWLGFAAKSQPRAAITALRPGSPES
jgi:hypothetical protein